MKLIPKYGGGGSAIYLNFPNFQGSAKNAVVVGGTDIGKAVLGNTTLPVGHAATILFDENGNATMYEYGRYDGKASGVIGTERRSVKGGNWKKTPLSRRKQGESYNAYITRIRSSIPSHYGSFTASYFPSVDYNAAVQYVNNSANNPNRSEYNLAHTCATEASNLIRKFGNVKTSNKVKAATNTGVIGAAKTLFSKGPATIGARLWGLLPGSTNQYNLDIQSWADDTQSFD